MLKNEFITLPQKIECLSLTPLNHEICRTNRHRKWQPLESAVLCCIHTTAMLCECNCRLEGGGEYSMFIVFTLNAYKKHTTSTLACTLPLNPPSIAIITNMTAEIKVRKTDWHVMCIVLGTTVPWSNVKKVAINHNIESRYSQYLKNRHTYQNRHPSIV